MLPRNIFSDCFKVETIKKDHKDLKIPFTKPAPSPNAQTKKNIKLEPINRGSVIFEDKNKEKSLEITKDEDTIRRKTLSITTWENISLIPGSKLITEEEDTKSNVWANDPILPLINDENELKHENSLNIKTDESRTVKKKKTLPNPKPNQEPVPYKEGVNNNSIQNERKLESNEIALATSTIIPKEEIISNKPKHQLIRRKSNYELGEEFSKKLKDCKDFKDKINMLEENEIYLYEDKEWINIRNLRVKNNCDYNIQVKIQFSIKYRQFYVLKFFNINEEDYSDEEKISNTISSFYKEKTVLNEIHDKKKFPEFRTLEHLSYYYTKRISEKNEIINSLIIATMGGDFNLYELITQREEMRGHNAYDYDEALSIIFILIKQLMQLHMNCIYHNDIKSSNIIVNEKAGTYFIIDFDSSYLIEAGREKIVLKNYCNEISNGYAAPQKISHFKNPNPSESDSILWKKDDIYSLGKVLERMVCNGKFIFDGRSTICLEQIKTKRDLIKFLLQNMLLDKEEDRKDASELHQIIEGTGFLNGADVTGITEYEKKVINELRQKANEKLNCQERKTLLKNLDQTGMLVVKQKENNRIIISNHKSQILNYYLSGRDSEYHGDFKEAGCKYNKCYENSQDLQRFDQSNYLLDNIKLRGIILLNGIENKATEDHLSKIEEIIEEKKEIFEENNLEVLSSMQDKAFILRSLGNYYASITLYKLIINSIKHSDNLKFKAGIHNNLALTYLDDKSHEMAIEEQKLALELMKDHYLKDFIEYHHDLSRMTENLAQIYFASENYPMAKFHLENAIKQSLKLEDERLMANLYNIMIKIVFFQEKFEEATDYMIKKTEALKHAYGETSPQYQKSRQICQTFDQKMKEYKKNNRIEKKFYNFYHPTNPFFNPLIDILFSIPEVSEILSMPNENKRNNDGDKLHYLKELKSNIGNQGKNKEYFFVKQAYIAGLIKKILKEQNFKSTFLELMESTFLELMTILKKGDKKRLLFKNDSIIVNKICYSNSLNQKFISVSQTQCITKKCQNKHCKIFHFNDYIFFMFQADHRPLPEDTSLPLNINLDESKRSVIFQNQQEYEQINIRLIAFFEPQVNNDEHRTSFIDTFNLLKYESDNNRPHHPQKIQAKEIKTNKVMLAVYMLSSIKSVE